MKFELSKEQEEKFEEWQEGRDPYRYAGASGGRWSFTFTPTSIGTIVEVRDGLLDKAKLDLTDYESW